MSSERDSLEFLSKPNKNRSAISGAQLVSIRIPLICLQNEFKAKSNVNIVQRQVTASYTLSNKTITYDVWPL